ncbi:MAG: flavodoxin family protein [Deltaproteobacteria bacterium]|jgi:flavodoxin|nr:flavodoxin family protein [Deltaproteobacteria bacterium]
MKTLVVFSSLTGNTQQVAQAIHEAIPGSDLFPIDSAPSPKDYGLIMVGFWVNRGEPDQKTKAFLRSLTDQAVAFFFTLGAYPDSDHASEVVKATQALIDQGHNQILGSFRCQGKVDPALIERMKKVMPPDHPHAQMSDERKARLSEAAKHPNLEDFLKARAFADDTYHKALSSPLPPSAGGRP